MAWQRPAGSVECCLGAPDFSPSNSPGLSCRPGSIWAPFWETLRATWRRVGGKGILWDAETGVSSIRNLFHFNKISMSKGVPVLTIFLESKSEKVYALFYI
jgi:hypothetical protein